MRNHILLPDPGPTPATSVKTVFDIPRGLSYNDITFEIADGGVAMTVAQMKARIDTIVHKFDGKPVREWTPTTLDECNATNGAQYAAAAGYLTDYFAEPWRREVEGEERGIWGTDGIGQWTIEVKFNAAAVAPTIKAWANVNEFNRDIRVFPIRQVRNLVSGQAVINGTAQIQNPLRNVGLFYDRLHFRSALISSVRLEVNKVVKWEDLPRLLVAEKLAKAGLALQTGVYTLAFDMTSKQWVDQLASFVKLGEGKFDVIQDLRIAYTGTGAGSMDVLAEQYEVWNSGR